jgi:hypothetical protein
VLSAEEKPDWGTKWGNFFEIGLLPRKFFQMDDEAYSRPNFNLLNSARSAA